MGLSKRQQEIYDYICSYQGRTGYPPTVREIGGAVGLTSSSTVHAHIAKLEAAGLLRRDSSKPRALELLAQGAKTAAGALKPGLPLIGDVAAGQGVLADEQIEDYLEVPSVVGGDEGEYILRVRGDSMIDAGILDGDYVVVKRGDTPRDGEIVVALLGEDATVKRYFKESDHIRLQPENATMEPIITRDVQILGSVVGVMRRV
ncbi:MAG: transcriptional repressor LexA [Solirubrobacterales bacterium]